MAGKKYGDQHLHPEQPTSNCGNPTIGPKAPIGLLYLWDYNLRFFDPGSSVEFSFLSRFTLIPIFLNLLLLLETEQGDLRARKK